MAAGAGLLSCETRTPAPPVAAQEIRIAKSKGELPKVDPVSTAWNAAIPFTVKMLVQDQVEPKLLVPGADVVQVRGLHDGSWIALRLDWADTTRDVTLSTAKSCDAAAVEFPCVLGSDVPDAAMGQPGKPVRIHLWKSNLQEQSGASGFTVAKADHYPFEHASEGARASLELAYAPARAAHNPLAALRDGVSVQDLLAEGFGTLRAAPEQFGVGGGHYSGSRWSVVISRPLDTGDKSCLRVGVRTYAAFALWDGGLEHRGARKMRSGWVPMQIEATP
jgi:DMSO reductase family type II enzyme heme b subunit